MGKTKDEKDRPRQGVKLPAHRAGLPGNVDVVTGSAFLPAPAAGRRGIKPTCP